MVEQILAVFLVLALLVTSLWLLRRKGMATVNFGLAKRLSPTKQMQVVDRVSLTPQHSLHLVRVQNQIFLVGVSPSGCNRIALLQSGSIDETT